MFNIEIEVTHMCNKIDTHHDHDDDRSINVVRGMSLQEYTKLYCTDDFHFGKKVLWVIGLLIHVVFSIVIAAMALKVLGLDFQVSILILSVIQIGRGLYREVQYNEPMGYMLQVTDILIRRFYPSLEYCETCEMYWDYEQDYIQFDPVYGGLVKEDTSSLK